MCQNKFDLSKNLTGSYYTLLSYNENGTNFDYLIYFIDYNKHINLFHYSFIYEKSENKFISNKIINDKQIEDPKSFTCQFNSNKILICFYIIREYLYVEFFNIKNNYISTHKDNITFNYNDNNNFITLKSSIINKTDKILILWGQKGKPIYYNIYQSNNFIENQKLSYCDTTNQLMEIFFYNNCFLFFCYSQNEPQKYLLYKMGKDDSKFGNSEKINIYEGNIVYDSKTWFLEDFNKECNLIIYNNQNENKESNTISTDLSSIDKDFSLTNLTSIYISSTKISSIDVLSTDIFSTSIYLNNISSSDIISIPSTDINSKDIASIDTNLIDINNSINFLNIISTSYSTYISSTNSISSTYIEENISNYASDSFFFSFLVSDNSNNNNKDIETNKIIEKNYLLSNLSSFLNDKEPGKIYKIKEEGYTIIIKPINSIIEPNSTYINFGECENILRNSNNISNSSFLTVLQIELDNNNSQSLINQVEYEIYDQNFSKLNLNVCKDTDIQIIYAIKDDILIDIEKINNLKNLGVDAFNINDSFFWDVCEPYSSDTGNDLILEDRIKDLYQNYSLCEEGCTYNDLSLENMTVSCNCKIKENITTVVSEINLDQIKYETTSNFDIIKCYDIIFKFKLKMTNIGFWIFTILLILHFPLIFHYFYTGIQPIHNFVINEMIKYGYLTNKQQPNSNIKNKTNKAKKGKKKKNKNNPPQKKKKSKNKKINNVLVIQNNIIKNSYNKLSKPLDSKNIINKDNKNRRKNKKKKLNKKINLSVNSTTKIDNSKSLIKNKRKNNGLTNMETENPVDKEKTNKNKIIDFTLITINLNHKKFNDYTPNQSYRVLNNYTFEEAIKYDHRAICEIFFIYLISKQAIFHAFFFKSPLQLFSLRLCLLFFIFSSDLALNAFFYFNDNISKKYHNAKNLLLFTFNNNLTVILLSTFIGFVLLTLFIKLTNCTNAMREVFQNEEEKMKKDKKYKVTNERKIEIKNEIEKIFKNYKIKIIVFIISELLFMIFFWYFVIIFCHVYKSTQTSWILDSFLTILSRIIIDCLICLGLAKLYRIGVESNIHCIYKFAMFLYSF